MKKLIAIAVVFALVAVGAAFADTSVSGNITARAKLISDTLDEADPADGVTSGQIETAYVQLSGQNDEGTFGGLARIRSNDGSGVFHRAFAWWKPIPQLKIFLGQDKDGMFCPYNAWSFFQGQEDYAHDFNNWENWRQGAGFLGNWDSFGAAISIYPVQGLEFNIVVPFGSDNNATKGFNDVWLGSLQLAASYAIPDIGKVFLNVVGPGEDISDDDKNANFGGLGFSFLLTAVEGLDVQLGFSTVIPGEQEDQPIHIGLIANYGAGDFGVKFRSRFTIGGEAGYGKWDSYREDGINIGVDVQPYYNLGVVRAFLNIGFVTDVVGDGDPVNRFSINPYIRKGMGPGDIRIGVLFIDPNLDADNDAQISIPVMFSYSF